MKPIVAPTDFSPTSLNAVKYAADFAALLGLRLDLLHVYAIPVAVSEIPVSFDVERTKHDANAQLDKLRDEMLERTSDSVTIRTVVRGGNPIGEIDDYCEKAKPYMVIMGAETAGVLERILFGGKTLEAIRNLRWPTLIVPPQAAFNNIRTIGVACDFKNVVETVRVKEIKELVNEFGAELHVLYVNDKTRGPYDPETVEESALLQKLLGDLRPKYQFLKEENIDAAIAEYAEKNKLDVLIIIPKTHTLAEQVFRHSHSKGVVLHSHVPVMSLHE